MIDRIEELLWLSAAEEDDEEREDAPALPGMEETVPVSPRRDGERAGETERADAAGELGTDGPVWTVKSGPSEMDEARRGASAERTAQTEEAPQPLRGGEFIWAGLEQAARGGTAGLAPDGPGRSGPARVGLEGLYRQTVQGLRPAAPALPPEQAGRTVRAQEPGSAASLAVDELDRAVRRDSRRYDGGMSIY